MLINVKSPQRGQLKQFFDLVTRFQVAQKVTVLRADITTFKAVIVAHRPSDNTFIVWDAYYHGANDSSTYCGFYNGRYDMTLEDAMEVFNKATR